MSTEEVNEVIARAERMREADEKETKRVVARTALETFCIELRFGMSWGQTDSKSQQLLDRAQDCLDWLKLNQEAREITYQQKLQHMQKESNQACRDADKNNNFGASKLSFTYCFQAAESWLFLAQFKKACEWFFKASKQAGNKQKENKQRALMKFGQVCRENAKNEKYNMEAEKLIYRGASIIVVQLKSGAETSSHIELAAELGKLKDVFFDKVMLFLRDLKMTNLI